MPETLHPVNAIMTLQTIRGILEGVLGHKPGIAIVMAGSAHLLVNSCRRSTMAGRAGDRPALIIGRVLDQAETQLGVVVRLAIQRGGFPAFRRVTGSAAGAENSRVLRRSL